MPEVSGQLEEKVEKDLCGFEYFATAADLWPGRTMLPYSRLSINFITDKWDLTSWGFLFP